MAASAHRFVEPAHYRFAVPARRTSWTGCRAAEVSAEWVAQVRLLRALEKLAVVRRTAIVEHELSHAEAAALADAGVMPLADYLDLASRNGWVDGCA